MSGCGKPGHVTAGSEEGTATYAQLLAAMRKYVIDQKQCGNPARMQDLREFRQWKNMPQDAAYDAALLDEINFAP